MRTVHKRPLILAMAALSIAACSDALTEPEARAVVGTYAAREDVGMLRAESDHEEWDLLADGGHVQLRLHADGTTSGELGLWSDESGFVVHDLTGSWSLDGDSVLLDHEADTFLRSMRLRYESSRLTGAVSITPDDRRIRVALIRE